MRVFSVFPDRADEVRAFLGGFPQRYVKTFGEQAAFHFQLAMQLPDDGVQLALDANHHLFELTVITSDRPRLFTTIVGMLFAWGMDIVKANAFCSQAGFVVDTFLFRDRFRSLVLNPSERERFKRDLSDLVTGGGDVEPMVRNRLASDKLSSAKVKVETRIEFDDECSPHSTLLEIIAQDKPGLLYTISSVLAAQQCNIELALIDTEGQMAIDVFYLTAAGRKLDGAHQQRVAARLREDLGA
jgi:[protein-PII] uridylyltransferase